MTTATPDTSLEDIRREIDAIDDGLLELLVRRFAASAQVRATKKTNGSLAQSPLRPAREALMLRRLIATSEGRLPPQVLVRLWRVILSASSQAQAPIAIHIDSDVAASVLHRVNIAQHFCGMPIESHASIGACLSAVDTRTGDLAAVAFNSQWPDRFSQSRGAGVHIIGTLPIIIDGQVPELLVFGHAEAIPCGDDETIILSQEPFAGATLRLRWQTRLGNWHVTGAAGFLTPGDIKGYGVDCLIAGRCPTSIEASV